MVRLGAGLCPVTVTYAFLELSLTISFLACCRSLRYVQTFPLIFRAHFVLICFSGFGSWRKLLAYALGTTLLSFGSCTKYSYPCFCANAIASSFVLNCNFVPCIKSALDCQPINGFSHRWPFPSTSQSIRHACEPQVPDWVAGRTGLWILVVF